ncbi:Zn-ribbon domain-containing OB-fold protein [Rhodococcus sp. KBS0724]|uniref:Zn-ribbon domain-containing OB-fold protein n=1 Tax=Rhodococcus sp. KBS0724 TaxID=1179674 RepID=UPI00110E9963|nr:Zn-ribbon domain-containing OB-fold protein [Rhodococcus sp. KBS0724]TSD40340.1 Zn-ribbon domain-containing OB-fold protein [Rhodococcus sp. KBS0724]
MIDTSRRPVPHPTALTVPFWEGCKRRVLTVQRCEDCGNHVFIPQSFCPVCLGADLSWVESGGVGSVVSYSVIWRAQTPAFEAPYVVAIVRVDEGYEMLSNIVDADPSEVSIGARVRVKFVDIDSQTTLPCFRLTR